MNLLRILGGSAVALFFSAAAALAQGAILQAGPATPGHAPVFIQNGIVQDSGPASGGGVGVGLSEQLLTVRGTGTAPFANAGTGPLNTNWCDYDAPITNSGGYHYICLSPNAQGGGLIAFGNAGGAGALPFNIIVNGVVYPFPFVTGGIVGPSTTVVGHIVTWNNTGGTLVADSGVAANRLVTGPSNSVSGDIAAFSGTSGTVLFDTGYVASQLAPLASPVFTGTVTMPDAATWKSTGIAGLTKLGIGTVPVDPLDITDSGNSLVEASILNPNGGTSSVSVWRSSNGTSAALFGQTGVGYSSGSAPYAASQLIAESDGTGGIALDTFNGGPIIFYIGNSEAARFPATGSMLAFGGYVGTGSFSSNGQGYIRGNSGDGVQVVAQGSINDFAVYNKSSLPALSVPTGTQNVAVTGNIGAATSSTTGNASVGGALSVTSGCTGCGPFTASFTGSAQAVPVPGATLTVSHTGSFSGVPFDYDAFFVETNAGGNCGWAQNDVIKTMSGTTAGTGIGVQLYADATNIYLLNGNSEILILTKGTGANCVMTQADWNVVLKAWQ